MTTCHPAVPVETIARTCHEVIRVWCEFNGDPAQKPWEFAGEDAQASSIAGVQFVLANPNAGDAAQHEQWARDRQAAGWVWGPVKDAQLKTHPCLVSFNELPPAQQFKDRLFRTVVLSMAEFEG